ncbi:uncharacterized protein LOC124112494 [Haliotis rufescens]|uniref:uncharacterized protein LOC124112494 n=1 Tax=Haliotis rufescens TaxID=6454 RepID=UPI00201E932A|nr:uncharacterized protein LOC124112494 [Haliotis rufescens]
MSKHMDIKAPREVCHEVTPNLPSPDVRSTQSVLEQWWEPCFTEGPREPAYSPTPPVIMISDDEARNLAALPPMDADTPTLLDVPPSPNDTFHGDDDRDVPCDDDLLFEECNNYRHNNDGIPNHCHWSCDVSCLFQGFEWLNVAINMVRTFWI